MRFLVHQDDFAIDEVSNLNPKSFQLNSTTSVNQLKLSFYSLLSQIGELIQLDNSMNWEELQNLTGSDDVIFASFHETPPPGLACRFLKHSLGSLMVVGGFLGAWEFRSSSCNMVTSPKQAEQLREGLRIACPAVGVLPPEIKNDVFFLSNPKAKEIARDRYSIDKSIFHIVYAGRIIANKGLTQLVRALNLWPVNNAMLSVVGNFEPDFFIYQSNAYNTTFDSFFKREVLERTSSLNIRMHQALPHEQLREVYWSADCFAYPSFHEDENFGLAPREAMLCGIPSVVTDFCGLGQLAGSKGGIVRTYPTLGGIRYSLLELKDKIHEIGSLSEFQKAEASELNSDFVIDECDQAKALLSLKTSVIELLSKTPGDIPLSGWRSENRINRWAEVGPDSFKKAIKMKKAPTPESLFVDGTGCMDNNKWFSDIHFMKAIQGFYTTLPETPTAQLGNCYRGFWRVSLWHDERALVEFGFPGPRVKRFNQKQWNCITSIVKPGNCNEIIFVPKNSESLLIIQDLMELGYLVPDKF